MAKKSRAEKRRMIRDPLLHLKVVAGAPNVPEKERLIAYGRVLVAELNELQMRMDGLGYTPAPLRVQRQEEITEKWNEGVEKIKAIQERLSQIEKDEQQKQSLVANNQESN